MKTRLKLYVILSATLALGVAMSISFSPASGASGPAASAPAPYAPQGACPAPTVPTSINPALATPPPDVCAKPNQKDLDLFSWLSFVAMNWPANTANCTPNTRSIITNTTGPRVWETYLTNGDIVVQPPRTRPLPWCPQGQTAQAALNAELLGVPQRARVAPNRQPITKVLTANSKAQDDLTQHFPSIGQAVGGVLTDLNGRFVRYEIRVNKTVYTYIINNTLWNLDGQKVFAAAGKEVDFDFGAIEIKAAWKVLGKNDDPRKFYTVYGVVFNDDNRTPSPGPNPVQLGLVGMHIITKTPNQPFWIWSTFEHDNNSPALGTPPAGPYNFYNAPNCSPMPCAPGNTQTADSNDPSELGANGQPLVKPVQAIRVLPIDNAPFDLNQTFKRLLAGSVWANYHLVSTQWTVNANDPDFKDRKLVPGWLANTTMETFNQGPPRNPVDLFPAPSGTQVFNPYNPDLDYRAQYDPFRTEVSSSCLKCHRASHTGVKVPNKTYKYPADFSFILGGAKPLTSPTPSR